MQKYTVVLHRPIYLSNWSGASVGRDVYIGHVSSKDIACAIKTAQKEVYRSDIANGAGLWLEKLPHSKKPQHKYLALSYPMVLVFAGHIPALLTVLWEPR